MLTIAPGWTSGTSRPLFRTAFVRPGALVQRYPSQMVRLAVDPNFCAKINKTQAHANLAYDHPMWSPASCRPITRPHRKSVWYSNARVMTNAWYHYFHDTQPEWAKTWHITLSRQCGYAKSMVKRYGIRYHDYIPRPHTLPTPPQQFGPPPCALSLAAASPTAVLYCTCAAQANSLSLSNSKAFERLEKIILPMGGKIVRSSIYSPSIVNHSSMISR